MSFIWYFVIYFALKLTFSIKYIYYIKDEIELFNSHLANICRTKNNRNKIYKRVYEKHKLNFNILIYIFDFLLSFRFPIDEYELKIRFFELHCEKINLLSVFEIKKLHSLEEKNLISFVEE